jgi:hypothetical protein
MTASPISPETMREHRARWFVYAGREKIRHTATMRGQWGYDVECSCGWKTRTGGGVRSYVEDELFAHRFSAQCDAERAATAGETR